MTEVLRERLQFAPLMIKEFIWTLLLIEQMKMWRTLKVS